MFNFEKTKKLISIVLIFTMVFVNSGFQVFAESVESTIDEIEEQTEEKDPSRFFIAEEYFREEIIMPEENEEADLITLEEEVIKEEKFEDDETVDKIEEEAEISDKENFEIVFEETEGLEDIEEEVSGETEILDEVETKVLDEIEIETESEIAKEKEKEEAVISSESDASEVEIKEDVKEEIIISTPSEEVKTSTESEVENKEVHVSVKKTIWKVKKILIATYSKANINADATDEERMAKLATAADVVIQNNKGEEKTINVKLTWKLVKVYDIENAEESIEKIREKNKIDELIDENKNEVIVATDNTLSVVEKIKKENETLKNKDIVFDSEEVEGFTNTKETKNELKNIYIYKVDFKELAKEIIRVINEENKKEVLLNNDNDASFFGVAGEDKENGTSVEEELRNALADENIEILEEATLPAIIKEQHSYIFSKGVHTPHEINYFTSDIGIEVVNGPTSEEISWEELPLKYNDNPDVTTVSEIYGNYYLTGNIIVSSKWDIPSDKTLNLCLNGYNMTFKSHGTITGEGRFNLCNCDESGTVSKIKTTENIDGYEVEIVYPNKTKEVYARYNEAPLIEVANAGIFGANNSNISFLDSVITNNYNDDEFGSIHYSSEESGGGSIIHAINTLDVINVSFVNNIAMRTNGTAINSMNASLQLENSVFNGNKNLTNKGGALAINTAAANIKDCTFVNNMSYSNGGAIVGRYKAGVDTSKIDGTKIEGGSIEKNQTSCSGGAAYFDNMKNVEITGVDVLNNYANYEGGAIVFDGDENSNLTFDSMNFIGNQLKPLTLAYTLKTISGKLKAIDKSSIKMNNTNVSIEYYGGALSIKSIKKVIIMGSKFDSNIAIGTKVAKFNNYYMHSYGGAIYAYNTNIDIAQDTLFNNNQGYTGATFCLDKTKLSMDVENGGIKGGKPYSFSSFFTGSGKVTPAGGIAYLMNSVASFSNLNSSSITNNTNAFFINGGELTLKNVEINIANSFVGQYAIAYTNYNVNKMVLDNVVIEKQTLSAKSIDYSYKTYFMEGDVEKEDRHHEETTLIFKNANKITGNKAGTEEINVCISEDRWWRDKDGNLEPSSAGRNFKFDFTNKIIKQSGYIIGLYYDMTDHGAGEKTTRGGTYMQPTDGDIVYEDWATSKPYSEGFGFEDFFKLDNYTTTAKWRFCKSAINPNWVSIGKSYYEIKFDLCTEGATAEMNPPSIYYSMSQGFEEAKIMVATPAALKNPDIVKVEGKTFIGFVGEGYDATENKVFGSEGSKHLFYDTWGTTFDQSGFKKYRVVVNEDEYKAGKTSSTLYGVYTDDNFKYKVCGCENDVACQHESGNMTKLGMGAVGIGNEKDSAEQNYVVVENPIQLFFTLEKGGKRVRTQYKLDKDLTFNPISDGETLNGGMILNLNGKTFTYDSEKETVFNGNIDIVSSYNIYNDYVVCLSNGNVTSKNHQLAFLDAFGQNFLLNKLTFNNISCGTSEVSPIVDCSTAKNNINAYIDAVKFTKISMKNTIMKFDETYGNGNINIINSNFGAKDNANQVDNVLMFADNVKSTINVKNTKVYYNNINSGYENSTIYVGENANVTFENIDLLGNTGTDDGYGIYTYNTDNVKFITSDTGVNKISGNTGSGHVIYIDGTSKVSVGGTLIVKGNTNNMLLYKSATMKGAGSANKLKSDSEIHVTSLIDEGKKNIFTDWDATNVEKFGDTTNRVYIPSEIFMCDNNLFTVFKDGTKNVSIGDENTFVKVDFVSDFVDNPTIYGTEYIAKNTATLLDKFIFGSDNEEWTPESGGTAWSFKTDVVKTLDKDEKLTLKFSYYVKYDKGDAPEGVTLKYTSTDTVDYNTNYVIKTKEEGLNGDEESLNKFLGWSIVDAKPGVKNTFEGGETAKNITNIAEETVVLKAMWKGKTYSVVFYASDSEVARFEDLEPGSYITEKVAEPTMPGYAFDYWYKEGHPDTAFDYLKTAIIENLNVYAKFVEVYTVSFEEMGGTTINDQIIKKGKLIDKSKTNSTRRNYTLEGWYEEDPDYLFDFTTPIERNYVLIAKWKEGKKPTPTPTPTPVPSGGGGGGGSGSGGGGSGNHVSGGIIAPGFAYPVLIDTSLAAQGLTIGYHVDENGNIIDINGKIVDNIVNGAVLSQDGSYYTDPSGTKHLADGSIVNVEGTMFKIDGSIVTADGTTYFTDGSKMMADGTVYNPDGSIRSTNIQQKGVLNENGIIYNTDGSITLPDGTTYLSDGSVIYKDGSVVKSDGTFVPKKETKLADMSAGAWEYNPETAGWKFIAPNTNGQISYVKNSWVVANNSNGSKAWFLTNNDGEMVTGWVKMEGEYYFMNTDQNKKGELVTGTVSIDGQTYSFNENGKLIGDPPKLKDLTVVGAKNNKSGIDGDWTINQVTGKSMFTLKGQGEAKGWQVIDGEYYLFDEISGEMSTGLKFSDEKLYYLIENGNDKGKMFTGEIKIGDTIYVFDKATGACRSTRKVS